MSAADTGNKTGPTHLILKDVGEERQRQIKKFGEQHHGNGMWCAILNEETGEAAKEAVEHHFLITKGGSIEARLDRLQNLQTELIQVAAVAVAWAESNQRRINEYREEIALR